MVRHASGRSEGETVDALDELLRRGLVREAGPAFDFAHPGLRDLAYESTSLTRRRLLHRRVAEALRLDLAGSGRDDLARLALIAAHERDGGRSVEAAEAFRLAGARAAAIFANREAIEHDEAALSLGHPDVVGLRRAIGRLRTRLGDYVGAINCARGGRGGGRRRDAPGDRARHRRVPSCVAATWWRPPATSTPRSTARRSPRSSPGCWWTAASSCGSAGDAPGALAAAREALAAAETGRRCRRRSGPRIGRSVSSSWRRVTREAARIASRQAVADRRCARPDRDGSPP